MLGAFLACAAPRLGYLTSVVILPQRQTVLTAKQAADLDTLVEEPGNEPAADASGGSGHEYGHDVDSFS